MNRLQKIILWLATAAALGASSVGLWAANTPTTASDVNGKQTVEVVTSQCTTASTGFDGRRKSCDSTPTVIKAPPGFVFVSTGPTGPKGGSVSANGSSYECRLAWSDYVELIPGTGISQPRTVTLSAHARSPKGHGGGRGWQICKYDVVLSEYQAE